MVSWSDESSSSIRSLPMDFSDMCPDWNYDSDFCGKHDDKTIRCTGHGMPVQRRVACNGPNTGRRYLGCSQLDDCAFVHWVDPELPQPLRKRLVDLTNYYALGENCKKEMEKSEKFYADKMLAEQDRYQAEEEKKVAITEKKKAELAAAIADGDRMRMEELKMKLELEMADYVSEATMKGEEIKARIKRLKNTVIQKEKMLLFAWALVAALVAFFLGFIGAVLSKM